MFKKIISSALCAVIMCTTLTAGVSAINVTDTAVGAAAAYSDNITPDFNTYTDTLLLVDTGTDEVVYSKKSDTARPNGSTTKIMTYIVVADAIDDLKNTQMVIESKPIEDIKGLNASVAGLENHIGESFSVLDILYALMVPSGCDAAQELAYFVGNGDSGKFVEMMNEKAAELGCTNTHFNDASGLSDENHYSTAEDMYKITKYAITLPYFTDVVSTEFYTLKGDTAPLINTNYLIDYVNGGSYYYQYATGVKTGYTDAAGKCLVSTAKKGDTELMCIALGAKYGAESNYVNYAMTDSKKLYEWAFDTFTENINVKVDKRFKSVQLGSQVQINAEITDSNIDAVPEIKWTSSNTDVATVDQNGVVTAHSMGETQIKAETQTGNFDVCSVACGYYNGIDVTSRCGDYTSGEKEPVDWAAVKEYGMDFAIIRAGWGSEDYPNQNDASFVENVKGAVENGIPFGLNFVAYAVDKETAKLEAEYLLREIEEYIPEYSDFMALPISYNMSDSQYAELTTEQTTEIALEFNRVMNEHGYKTMCYANKSVFNNIDIAALKNSGMKLWYAYYPYEFNFSQSIKINEVYTPDVWQYRTDGYIPEASEESRTRKSIIYMLSSELDQFAAPEISAEQLSGEKAVKISWSQVDYETSGYAIYRKSADNIELEKIAEVSSSVSNYTDTDLNWNDCYTYYVAAKVTDFLDKTYEKEILGVCDYEVTVINPEPITVYGDVDTDGVITVMDATLIQKAGVDLETLSDTQTILADVNQDGRVSVVDATLIQKYIAEIDYGEGVVGQPCSVNF